MKLRVGVSGLGRGASFVQKLSSLEQCEVVAVCDPNPKALAAFAALQTFTDYDEFLAKSALDVVACIGPGPTHCPQALAALNAGVHVISETPCVYSADEAAQIVAAVERTGLKYMLSEDYIFMGWCQRLKELVSAGVLGEIVYAEGEYTHDCRGIFFQDADGRFISHDEWLRQGQPGLSWRATHLPPLTYCSHTLGPILHLLDDRCVSVVGLSTGHLSFPGTPIVDLESCLCKTTRGAVIRLTNGFGVAHPFGYWLSLVGSKGSLRLRAMDWPLGHPDANGKSWPRMDLYIEGETPSWREEVLPGYDRADGSDWMVHLLSGFMDAVINDTKPPLDVYESMAVTLPGVLGHESGMRGGEMLEVPVLPA
jgi:predicted dehydrogenase